MGIASSASATAARRPAWALPVIVIAVVVVLAATVAGIRGLTQNPVIGTDSQGVTTIRGDFEPYGCGTGCVEGYVQAGARSVFVIFPGHCAAPSAGSQITVRGRLDTGQGSATYRSLGCP